MTKFSYLYLVAVFSCVIIHAADQGSPARLVGAKRRTSNPDAAAISATSGRAIAPTDPSTPKRLQKAVIRVSPGGRQHKSPVLAGLTPLRDKLPDGLDTDAKRVAVLFVLKKDSELYSTPERKALACVVNEMADYEVARPILEAATAAGIHLSPGRVRSVVVSGHYDAAKANGKSCYGIPQLRSAIAEAGVSVTPGLHWDHIASPTVRSNGMILGGHIGSAYESNPSLVVADRVDLPGGKAAIFTIRSSDPSKTKVSVKSVLLGGAASQASASQMLRDAEIIASSDRGGRLDLLQSGGTVFGGYRAGIDSYDYNTNFIYPFVKKDDLSCSEVILGERGGVPVTVSSEALISQVRAQASADALVRSGGPGKESLTVFSDAFGPHAVGGIEISEFPSHVVVELTDEMRRSLPLSPVPAYNLPAKVGSQVKVVPIAPLAAHAASPILIGGIGGFGGAASSVSGHELK